MLAVDGQVCVSQSTLVIILVILAIIAVVIYILNHRPRRGV